MNEEQTTERSDSGIIAEHRKKVRNDAKKRAAQIFDRAVRHCVGDTANADIADRLHVTETRVASLRSDDRSKLDAVPSIVDILLADHELAEFLLQEIRNERIKIHGDAPPVTPEQRLHRAMRRVATFTAITSEALENGALEDHEKPGIEEQRMQAMRELEALGRDLALAKHGGRR